MTEKKARILLIDDDVDFVDAMRTILESASYAVSAAPDGNSGLEKAKKEKPDLILLDIIMPVADGFTAAEQLKKDPQLKKIPLLMLTGYSAARSGSSIAVGRGYVLEADEYLDKPIKPEDLLAIVRKHLKKGRKG